MSKASRAAKRAHKKANKQPSTHDIELIVLIITVIVLITMIVTLVATNYKQLDTIGKYEILERIDNQACRYLDQQPEVNGSFDLNVNAPIDHPKLSYTCTNGQKVDANVIHGKPVGAYSMGASVIYFRTQQEALRYAEQKLNPLRYWEVTTEEPGYNIPQTSSFVFVVSEPPMYFDSYTVKANAVLRVSLPCPNPDDPTTAGDCQEHALSMLRREMKGINIL